MVTSVLITGCSSGIGLKTARLLKKKGYLVFPTARRVEDLEKLQEEGFHALNLDVTHPLERQAALDTILENTGGTLDVLFNNAGYVQPGAVEDLTEEMMRMQFETNVFGAMALTNEVLPIMRKQGHGRIIQNSSILGLVPMCYRGAYVASKFALEGFSNTLRLELHDTDISVSILVPGPVYSELRHKAYTIFQSTLHGKPTVHQKEYAAMETYFFAPGQEKKRRFVVDPEVAALKVLSIIESKKPKAHYYVGSMAYLFAYLRRLLPDSMLDFVMLKSADAEKKQSR